MEFVKRAIWGPDPKEQYRKCQTALRRNKRQMERQIQDLNRVEKKTKGLIRKAAKKGDIKSAKMYAREYRNVAKTQQRMHVSLATLDSISMKLAEQQQLIKIKGSMQKSTEIMRDMNTLVRLPEMSRTVRELTMELTKSGVIDEMVDDMIDEADLDIEDEDEEEAIDEIVQQVLQEEVQKAPSVPSAPLETKDEPAAEEEAEDDQMLENMRQRLSALQE